MDSAVDQSAVFVNRLLANPALQGLNALQKEEQILQFLSGNAATLLPTLSSPAFFPGKNWNHILAILTTALYRETEKTLLPELEQLIKARLSFSFLAGIQPRQLPVEKCREELYELVRRLLQKPEARRALSGPLAAIQHGFVERYIDRCFRDRQYVHFELTKVQRLRLEAEDISQLIKATLLLRPAVQLLAVGAPSGQAEIRSGLVQPQFAQTAFESLKSQLRFLPAELLRGALYSNVSFLEDAQIDATARNASIFSARARSYKPVARVDRGASTPDRSWLSIARKNFKHYGFDIKMLDEFYKIASENRW